MLLGRALGSCRHPIWLLKRRKMWEEVYSDRVTLLGDTETLLHMMKLLSFKRYSIDY